MATISSSPRARVGITESGAQTLWVPLRQEDEWRESLTVYDGGCVSEDARCRFTLELDGFEGFGSFELSVNGELVVRDGLPVAAGTVVCESDCALVERPFQLIFGYARIEVRLCGESVVLLHSDDIPVLVRGGDKALEQRRISSMYETLFGEAGDGALGLMLTGVSGAGKRFSIVEGVEAASSPKGLSTFMQLAEKVLTGFEDCLPAFRTRATSRVVRSSRRVPRERLARMGSSEALWIARNPECLERVVSNTPITDGRACYLPRYVETELRTKSFDTYENRCVIAFLDQAARRMRSLADLLEDGVANNEMIMRRLSPLSREGYVLSSLLVTDVALDRRKRSAGALDRLATRAAVLAGSYRRAVPGVATVKFVAPRRSKVFQEVDHYGRLYHLIQMWCSFGDVDMSSEGLAIKTERMDTFYEYYVLHELLASLANLGFVPDADEENPVSTVRYANTGQFDGGEQQVANKYLLSNGGVRLQLYYQPVFHAVGLEENGVTLHRTSASKGSAPFTPDFLIRISDNGAPWRDVVLDAKYSKVRSVVSAFGGTSVSRIQRCLMKYKLESFASDTRMPPLAVWLVCGRENEPNHEVYDASPWAIANPELYVPSGATALSPLANNTGKLFSMLGLAPYLETSAENGKSPVEGADASSVVAKSMPADKVDKTSKAPDEREKPVSTAYAEKSRKASGAFENVERMVIEAASLMLDGGEVLYKAKWAQKVLNLSEPLLRKSLGNNKREAKRYRPIELNGSVAYLNSRLMAPQITCLRRYLESLREKVESGD